MKTPALYTKGQRFEPHRRRFFTPTVVLLSFNKPETVLWTIAKILLLLLLLIQRIMNLQMKNKQKLSFLLQKYSYPNVMYIRIVHAPISEEKCPSDFSLVASRDLGQYSTLGQAQCK